MKADMSMVKSKKFGTILADPPWPLTGGKGGRDGWSKSQAADYHYPVMTVPQLVEMGPEVQRVALPDSHLYLWVVNNFLPAGLEVMEAWGFRYVTCITWYKTSGAGLGQYFTGKTEHCLFGIRGKPGYQSGRPKGTTGFQADRMGHSVKPPIIHGWAEEVSPGPRLEMFARQSRPGWACWGQEGYSDRTKERRSA